MHTLTALGTAGFNGPEDYIEKITYAIWNTPERDPGLVERWYASDCVIHTDWGDLNGIDTVVANTRARLVSYPDFEGRIDDTIWVERPDGTLRTSMRWRWTGTDVGGTPFGGSTGRRVRHLAIAECVVVGTAITREWLGSDMSALARQLGSTTTQARDALSPGRAGFDPQRFVGDPPFEAAGRAGETVCAALADVLAGRENGRLISPDVRTTVSGDESGSGATVAAQWAADLSGAGTPRLVLHDQYALTSASGPLAAVTRVATRAELRFGAEQRSAINLSTHHHLQDGRIMAQWLLADRLAAGS